MRVFLTMIAAIAACGIAGTAFSDPPSKAAASGTKSATKVSAPKGEEPPEIPWKKLLGEKLTLVGRGENRKVGARLQCDGTAIWVDLPDNGWPQHVYNRTAANPNALGRKVKVTGKLEQWSDLPVFTPSQNRGQAGIPVPEGTNLEEARKRFILVDVKWELVPEKTPLSTRAEVIATAKERAAAPKSETD